MSGIEEKAKCEAYEQIRTLRNEISYDTRDYSVDFLVKQFQDDEFFIPDEYQRQFIWEDDNKTRFIESILLGLPIPFMFFSDTDDGRCEIIDGAQRTQTLEEFMSDDLKLSKLKKLTLLNGFTYQDLPEYYRKKFNKTTLRIVVLSDTTSLEIRQEIFNRINTTGKRATASEIRRGSFSGPFMDFLNNCRNNTTFIEVCPVSENSKKRYDDLELVIRFFAFLNNYENFSHRVDEFCDEYVSNVSEAFNEGTLKEEEFKMEFERMIKFVEKHFEYGFRKTKTAKSTPRVRFEAIAVGVGLALRENEHLEPKSMEWVQSEKFRILTTSHASNSPKRVKDRIEYVRDQLLSEN